MTNGLRAPTVTHNQSGPLSVIPNEEFLVDIKVTNNAGVVDAYDITVLGVDPQGVAIETKHRPLPLFPEKDGLVTVGVTLRKDFPSGPRRLWIKALSRSDPAVFELSELEIDVAERPSVFVGDLDPKAATGGRTGRFGLTLHNDGNTPLDLDFRGRDDDNRLTIEFVPQGLRPLKIGERRSVQVTTSGRRNFSGPATPTQFKLYVDRKGEALEKVDGSLTQRPYVPQVALVFAMFVLLLGIWAVIVGAAIDAVMGDAKDDVAKSFESGMNSVIDGLADDDAALEDTRQIIIAAPPGPGEPTSSDTASTNETATAGEQADRIPPTRFGGSRGFQSGSAGLIGIGSGSANGLAGIAINVTLEADDSSAEQAVIVPADAVIGTVVAGSDSRPIPGTKVTLQATVEKAAGDVIADPNRDPLTVVADDQGLFSAFKLLPGEYSVTLSAPGYQTARCSNLVVPSANPCEGLDVIAGALSTVELEGTEATTAGIVTGKDGNPLQGAIVTIARVGAPSPGDPAAAEDGVTEQGCTTKPPDTSVRVTLGGDGRFCFKPDPATIPGVFEVTASWEGTAARANDPPLPQYATKRLTVTLNGGDNIIGQELSLTQVPETIAEPPKNLVLAGTVTHQGTGDPLEGVLITVTGATGSPDQVTTTVTDTTGAYAVSRLEAGTYNVRFALEGYRSTAANVVVEEVDGELTTIRDVALAGGARIRGTVTDSSTQLPISGVTVSVGGASQQTDGVGGYDFVGLIPRVYTATFTAAAGYEATTATVVFDGAEVRVVDVAMLPNGSMSGTASGSNGELVQGATVTARGLASGRIQSATTNADGAYALTSLSPEAYDVEVTAFGYNSSTVRAVSPGSGRNATLVPKGSVTANVTAPTPVTLQLLGPLTSTAPVSATATSPHTFPSLAPGPYRLTYTYTRTEPDPVDPGMLITVDVIDSVVISVSEPTTLNLTLP